MIYGNNFLRKGNRGIRILKKTGEISIVKKIRQLLESIQLSPFEGIAKPEALKHNLSGFWSRRITQEHRLVYRIGDDKIIVVQLRFHY